MPNIQVKLRRGTATEHSGFTGAEGEVTVDTTNDTLRVHDGSTVGGVRLAKLSEAGGSGTVTEVDSGTGLTGGPITTSGTLSLASIANLRALGNVSGSTAAPTAVEIKDEDAMTSNSATALATQQSIKAYVDSQLGSSVSKYTAAWNNSHGGVTVADASTHTITHNLGTTDVQIAVYINSSGSDTNAQSIGGEFFNGFSAGTGYGFYVTSLSSNALVLQLGSQGWLEANATGNGTHTQVSFNSYYLKIVVIG